MWEIYEHKRVSKQLISIPSDVLKRYEKWKDIVAISALQGLRKIIRLHDQSLSGKWKGHRSSRLNQQYRIIYKIEKDKILVQVVNITSHDYMRK